MIWGAVEINVAIICASLLVMKPLWVKCAMASETLKSSSLYKKGLKQVTGQSVLTGRSVDEEEMAEQGFGGQSSGDASVGGNGSGGDGESNEVPAWTEIPTGPTSSAIDTSASDR